MDGEDKAQFQKRKVYALPKPKKGLSLYKTRQQRKRNPSSVAGQTNKRGRPKKRKIEVPQGRSKIPRTSEFQKIEVDDTDAEIDVCNISDDQIAAASEEGESYPSELEQSFIATAGSFTIVSDEQIDVQSTQQTEDSDVEETFQDRCLKTLTNPSTWNEILEKLAAEELLYDFMNLIKFLASGELSILNIVFLLLLDRVRWQNLQTTTQMRYHTITMKFWSAMYILCGGVGITFCSGLKNKTQVMTQKTEKGNYKPVDSNINFAVPDERHLRKYNHKLPKQIYPGRIESSLELLSGQKDRILMADLKSLAKGFRGHHEGDCDLWGFEKPTLEELDRELAENKEYARNIRLNLMDYDKTQQQICLKKIMKIVVLEIEKVRKIQLKYKRKLHKYENMPTVNVKSHIYIISECKTYLNNSNLWIEKCAQFSKQILHHLANLMNSEHMIWKMDEVVLSQCSNARILHDVSYIRQHVDIDDETELVKQRSEEWKKLREACVITGSTCFNALGLRNRKSMDEHYDEFVYKKGRRSFTDEEEKRMEHGRVNEVVAQFIVLQWKNCSQ